MGLKEEADSMHIKEPVATQLYNIYIKKLHRKRKVEGDERKSILKVRRKWIVYSESWSNWLTGRYRSRVQAFTLISGHGSLLHRRYGLSFKVFMFIFLIQLTSSFR